MSAQAAIAAKTAVSAISITGTALSILPRGRVLPNNVLSWVAPGATSLDDVTVDFSYRMPTSTRKTVKSTLRAFVPKTATVDTVVTSFGTNVGEVNFTFPEAATAAERQKLVDILTSALCSTEFRTAITTGDVMY